MGAVPGVVFMNVHVTCTQVHRYVCMYGSQGISIRLYGMYSTFKFSQFFFYDYILDFFNWSLQKSRTTFNIDHARWGRARDAYNSRMMDHRSNINNDRMVFGSL